MILRREFIRASIPAFRSLRDNFPPLLHRLRYEEENAVDVAVAGWIDALPRS